MQMLRLEREEMLWFYAVVPALVALFTLSLLLRKRAMKRFAAAEMWEYLSPEAPATRYQIKFWLCLAALCFIVFALAGPGIGSSLKEVERKGKELIIALDVSNSMLAEDMSPNRLEAAKHSIQSILLRRENDRFGLIVFAGDAYTQIPITDDASAAGLFINAVSTDMISKQGTSLESAIRLGISSFGGNEEEKEKTKALIIITDGEDHEPGALDAAKEAAGKGVVIHTIGIGDSRGVPIPMSQGSTSYKRDREGNVVITRLNEDILKSIAVASGGLYVRAGKSGSGLRELMDKIDELDNETYTARVFDEYNERYQVFLGTGLLLLLAELLLAMRKNKFFNSFSFFETKS